MTGVANCGNAVRHLTIELWRSDEGDAVVSTSPPSESASTESAPQTAKPAPGPTTKVRPAPAPENYRGRYNAARAAEGKSRLPEEWDAHHRVPREYQSHPEFQDFDFNAPSNIQGVKGTRADINIHQDITNAWAEFRKANPHATRKQIEEFANSVDRRFQQHWWR